jgi:hypothetical protein
MKLTIDRAKWLRGEGFKESMLLRSYDDKMCCLGFYARACGVPKAAMIDIDTPYNVKEALTTWTKAKKGARWLFASGRKFFTISNACQSLMKVNDDDEEYTEAEREARITMLFSEHGVEVEFVGE